MSQMTPEEKKIGEHKYEMYMLAPIKSHNLLMDVAKMAGPALGQAIGALFGGAASDEDVLEREVTTDLLSGALGQLFEDLDKKTMEQVIDGFKEVTHVDGKSLDKIFDAHFRGKLHEMYEWIAWGFSVQWGKSLNALVSGVSGQGVFASRRKKQESESPST